MLSSASPQTLYGVWTSRKERMASRTAALSLTMRIQGCLGVMVAETSTALRPRQYGFRLIDDTDFDL
jgi:hypothetical protein